MKKRLVSVILSAFIISLIIMAGPARGVNVDLNTDKEIYTKGEDIIFNANIDIENNERIPARELTLELNGVDACKFNIQGEIISGCQNMNIELTANPDSSYGYGYGYGYGFNGNENKGTNFGYGYGYGNTNGNELAYKITWNTENASIGDYEAKFAVLASNDENAEYLTEDSSNFRIIELDLNSKKETVYAEDANEININNTDSFDRFGKITFNGDFRQKDVKGIPVIAGYGTLNIDAYKDDSTHISLQARFKPEEINIFNAEKTDLKGTAKISYQRNKKGIRVGNQWIGAEPTQRFNGDVQDVKFKLENGKLSLKSNDPLLQFNSEDMIIAKLDYSEYTYEFQLINGRVVRKTNINKVRIP